MSLEKRNSLTLRNIKETYAKILLDKEPDKITVTEICEKADVSRSTFYSNYQDEADLLEKLMDELIDTSMSILDRLSPNEDNESIVEDFLTYVQDNTVLFKPFFLNAEHKQFKTRMLKVISDKIYALSGRDCPEVPSYYDEMFRLYTISGGFVSVILWVKRGFDIDKHECAKHITEYTRNAIITSKQLN